MHRERLLKLRKALAEHQDNGLKFNMGYWGRYSECGTECCAAGLYCIAYPHEELQLIFHDTSYGEIRYGPYDSYKALAKFFEISTDKAVYLFYADSYRHNFVYNTVNPGDVIARIDELLERVESQVG